MKNTSDSHPQRVLVVVFDDFESAGKAILMLRNQQFTEGSLELVSHDLQGEAPDVTTPSVTDTSVSRMIDSAIDFGGWGLGAGAIAGIAASLLTGFPGIGLGMLMGGGMTGAFMGGMAGVDESRNDDSVDLPSVVEYKNLVESGFKLLVVRGNPEELEQARQAISDIPHSKSHMHPLHGRAFHNHPAPPIE